MDPSSPPRGIEISRWQNITWQVQSRKSPRYYSPWAHDDYADVKADRITLGSAMHSIMMDHEVFPNWTAGSTLKRLMLALPTNTPVFQDYRKMLEMVVWVCWWFCCWFISSTAIRLNEWKGLRALMAWSTRSHHPSHCALLMISSLLFPIFPPTPSVEITRY